MENLATIEKIKKVRRHENADKLELCDVLGYQCVSEKGLYSDGDLIVYIKTDTILPEEEWAEPYRKYSPKRVKAIKLRGEFSEGILLPIEIFMTHVNKTAGITIQPFVGLDVTEMLGVQKYEPPVPQNLDAVGFLPYEISKTDEERFENFSENRLPFGKVVDVTLKYDGTSTTYYYNVEDNKFGVTSRSLDIDITKDNIYTKLIDNVKDKIINYCKKHNISLAFRGETYGNNIQKMPLNPHATKNLGFACYNIYDIKNREYCKKGKKHYFVDVCEELNIEYVDIVEKNVILTPELLKKYSTELKKINGNYFEGVVIKHSEGSFKIINKHYDSNK